MRYPSPEATRRLTLAQIAHEIDESVVHTRKLLAKTGFIGWKRRGSKRAITYDAAALDVLKAMLEQPHRVVSDDADWLEKWINKGGTHGF